MTLIKKIKEALHKPSLVIGFMRGHYRSKIYYSRFKNTLLRQHIIEQFEYRMNSIPKECYNSGQCKECGCAVPALQMDNRACDAMCYPDFVNKKLWNNIVKVASYAPYGEYGLKNDSTNEYIYLIDTNNKRFVKTAYKFN